VCSRCNRARGFGKLGNEVLAKELLEDCALRIAAPQAIRCCDDPSSWDWRAYLDQRDSNQPV